MRSTREGGVTKPTISHPEWEPKESVRESLTKKKDGGEGLPCRVHSHTYLQCLGDCY